MRETDKPHWTLGDLRTRVHQTMKKEGIGWLLAPVPLSVTARNVRYYIHLGLMDKPLSYHRGEPRFGPRHAYQLLAIRALQSRGLNLGTIQECLYGLNPSELVQLARSLGGHTKRVSKRSLGQLPRARLMHLAEDRATFLNWLQVSELGLLDIFCRLSKN